MSITRCRVFLVEDEAMIALLIEDMLDDLGFDVVGVSARLTDGLDQAATIDADLAILDINLNGQQSFPIADVLRERGIPFMFATGYGTKGLNDAHRQVPTLKKPFLSSDLAKAMQKIVGSDLAA